ncbi:hypothetical protein IIA28_11620 [candidate division KSB1 bacterium]|nr:hypothetical protein [candidate division KSB1 bacterium]
MAFGLVFQSLTGVPMHLGISGGALVIFVYTVAGGLWAVALTDFVQMSIIAIGLILLSCCWLWSSLMSGAGAP